MTREAMGTLLIVTRDREQLRQLSTLAARAGCGVAEAEDGAEALDQLTTADSPTAMLIDHDSAPHLTNDVIRKVRTHHPFLPVLFLAKNAAPQLAVEAIRAGATDYLLKPVDGERLRIALNSARQTRGTAGDLEPLTEQLAAPLDFEAMVGTAPAFRTALAKAATAARGQANSLIYGEAGTGKNMVVRAMHAASPRAKNPIMSVSVANASAGGIGSLLFGHEKGAFPGAFESRIGILQQCDGGAIVIEDLDRLDIDTQQHLARTMTEGIVRPLGARHGFHIDVRFFATLDRDPAELVGSGALSPDLAAHFTATIGLPSLRERAGDIPALTRYFLSRIGEQPGVSHHSIADSGLNLLEAYDWPGNVRQLQAVLFRAAVASEDEALTATSFPQLSELLGDMAARAENRQRGLSVMLYTEDGNLRPLEEIEADVIRLAIGHYRGRMTEVARRLGIGRSTLYRKLSDLGIDNAA